MQYAEQYNRARHYSSTTSQWTTVDPVWPEEAAYGYVNGRVTTFFDPNGMRGVSGTIAPADGVSFSICAFIDKKRADSSLKPAGKWMRHNPLVGVSTNQRILLSPSFQ